MQPQPVRPISEAALAYSVKDLAVDVTTKAGPKRLIDRLDFTVRKGEILSIIGTSGAGKTTLLRVLGGLIPATKDSEVLADGRPIQGPPDRVLMVFQDYASSLLPWRTIRRNVALGLETRYRGGDLQDRVDAALDLVGLRKRADEYPWRLSGGMQQRVQIARALAMEPQVLLMDEPFGALDAITKTSLQDELLRVQEQTGATIIFITHDVEEAVYLGDRVLALGGIPGRIVDVFDVDLPRPRHQIHTKEMPEFLRLRHQAYESVVEAELRLRSEQ
ncbi:ABC transporter ATP-binding protein [Microbacterium oryzae]|uniref:ABC transporter ATP-binding protein n=1 Tax=Microbacterium oryzae TaxID=743009 RepID=UPI0025B176B2|nr:ABC transporter ATP-binding protein [Microbacterium oryzae]MDN3309762.1 ABC transporter ATP-binding protein [Microbacterium oryzae]